MALSSSAWQYTVHGGTIGLNTGHETGYARFGRRKIRGYTGDTALSRCLSDIARILREDYGRAFAQAGPGWLSLKPATIKRKAALGLPPKGMRGQVLPRLRQINASGANSILIASGDLRDSYRQKGAPGHIEEIDLQGGTVTVGSALPYAGVHQRGAVLRRVKSGTGDLVMVKKAMAAHKISARRALPSSGGGVIPARPVIISSEARRLIRERIAQYLAETAKTEQE